MVSRALWSVQACALWRKRSLDLAEIQRDVRWDVFSAANCHRSDGAIGREFSGRVFEDCAEECLPLVVIAREFGGVQPIRNEFVNQEQRDVGVPILRLNESCGCGVEKLITQQPDPGVQIPIEQRSGEAGDPCRNV